MTSVLCCGILRKELEHLFANREDISFHFLEPALHVDLSKLKSEIDRSLKETGCRSAVFGVQCHPDLKEITEEMGCTIMPSSNCIEMLLGEKMASMDAEAKTFYITTGWLENWQKIFVEGLGWGPIDARQNFGYYDRIVLLDTGITPIDDMQILEFFEYTQVPVEIMTVGLDRFHCLVEKIVDK